MGSVDITGGYHEITLGSAGEGSTQAGGPGDGGSGPGSTTFYKGGNGGDWGEPGEDGLPATGFQYPRDPGIMLPTSKQSVGGKGGPPGKAIITNGNTLEWIGGNNANRVKGAIE